VAAAKRPKTPRVSGSNLAIVKNDEAALLLLGSHRGALPVELRSSSHPLLRDVGVAYKPEAGR
jgi:hypothetical protein